jgi:carboxynorspermidine decarboxylase
MQTQAGEAGSFARFDLSRVPSPCFVIDEVAIERNLKILAAIADQSGARILSALKAFSLPHLAPLVGKYLAGTCASGLYEARMGRMFYGGELATYCTGYKPSDLSEIIELSDHLIFNSQAQKERFLPMVRESGKAIYIGLRINPEHSESPIAKYDPCAPFSRLGIPVSTLTPEMMREVDGLHMHSLCEQDFAPLERTWNAVLPHIEKYLPDLKWINFGGGHHLTRADYDREALVAFIGKIKSEIGLDIYLEPGEAVALDAGILIGEILDLPKNAMNLAITNISATCHMPDVLEAPYRPQMMGEVLKEVEGEVKNGETLRFGGPSCLAGDVIGDYRLARPPEIGDRIAFLDQAHYSLVKTNTFNGVPLPAIAVWNSNSDELRMVREFGYHDFLNRLM